MDHNSLLTRYQITLSPDRPLSGPEAPRPEWAYRLYSALLADAPPEFGDWVHRNAVAPVSQFFVPQGDSWRWTVTLLGEDCAGVLAPCLEAREAYYLDKERVSLRVTGLERHTVADVDALFALAQGRGGSHTLRFRTPTAFKSQKRYVSLPSPWLLMQNLVNRWNGCITHCPIDDEDGQGLRALADGLRFSRFRLESRVYHLKGSGVPGFTGDLTVENGLRGFHRQLADALLIFAAYSGVGIKTTLGMGGVEAL